MYISFVQRGVLIVADKINISIAGDDIKSFHIDTTVIALTMWVMYRELLRCGVAQRT